MSYQKSGRRHLPGVMLSDHWAQNIRSAPAVHGSRFDARILDTFEVVIVHFLRAPLINSTIRQKCLFENENLEDSV